MNPNGHPFDPNFGAPPPPGAGGGGAREQLTVPAILFMVAGVLGILNGLVSIAMAPMIERFVLDFGKNDPAIAQAVHDALASANGPVARALNFAGIALLGLMTFGAWQMKNLKSYGLAIATCVIGLLPLSSCCCLTLPVGIWGLVVLLKPEVKAEFR